MAKDYTRRPSDDFEGTKSVSASNSFLSRLETKVAQHLCAQNVGYLLGAGASYLDGRGYPLAGQLWTLIKDNVPSKERGEIQAKLDAGADGIENALDLLDDGGAVERPHRHLVTEAIARHLLTLTPPLDAHMSFVSRLQARAEPWTPIFCLNYDGLVEVAADRKRVRLIDGFLGCREPYFEPHTFQERHGLTHRGPRKPQVDWLRGILHLYKLHGSLGWFDFGASDVRRLNFDAVTPTDAKRLMIPPQHRKATDTTTPPYSALWSDFRAWLCHGPQPKLLNRLVAIGYGMRDEHLNAIVENALARTNFTLLVFAYELRDAVFERWSAKKNVILVTSNRCSLYKEVGAGHPDLWNFTHLSQSI